MLHVGQAVHVATGLVGRCRTSPGSGHLQAPHFSLVFLSFFLWLAFPWSSEQRMPTSAIATVRVGHISLALFRSSDDLLLRLFSVGPRVSTGLELGPSYQRVGVPLGPQGFSI